MFVRIAPEQHDTLPEIPEPSENPALFGHEDAASMLASAYRAGKLHHGLIFAGPPGIGKATLAFHLAHHILKYPVAARAPAILERPEPESSLFRLVAQDAHPSLLHLTRPARDNRKGFKTVVTVDEIRKVNRFLSMTAHDGGYRIVIVDPADDMNTNAANALLKSLEEPPARTLFILITHQMGRLLPTIRSRCQTIKLGVLGDEALSAVLSGFESGVPENPAARAALAARAGGSARAAILLTQYGGLEIAEAINNIAAAPVMDIAEAHKLADAVSGRDQAIQFELLNNTVLDEIAAAARRAAEAGDSSRADRLSGLWQDVGASIVETETYNLDRKQHVLNLLSRLHAATHR